MTSVLARETFYRRLATVLEVDANELMGHADSTFLDIGIDSALVIDVILVIDDLGIDLGDDINWGGLTPDRLYRMVSAAMVDQSLR